MTIRQLVLILWAALALAGCSRKASLNGPIERPMSSAPSGPPDWVATAGTSLRYPESVYLVGYGLAEGDESVEALRGRATDHARTQLAERVLVRLKSETELYQETDRPDQLRVLTETETQLELEGLQQEEWRDSRRNAVHVLAYARRDLLQSLYAERTKRAYGEVSRPYREGQRLEAAGRPSEALKAYRRAERAFGRYDEERLITRALGSRLTRLDDDATAAPITRDSIVARIAAVAERPIRSAQDLAFALALGLHAQVGSTSDTVGTVAVAPFTVEGTPFGSALGRHLQGLVERELARLGPLRVVSYSSAPNGRVRADNVVRGSYGLSEPSLVHATLKRQMGDGRGRLVASTDAQVTQSLLRGPGLALEAENGPAARESYTEIKENEVAPTGGLRFEVWTNRGTESAVVTEGDTVWVYLRSSRAAYVRLLYRLTDGRTVLLYDNFQIRRGQENQVIRLPQAFVAAAPFGAELMTALAADRPFGLLRTRQEGGYAVVGELADAAQQSRGLVPVPTGAPPKPSYGAFAERTLGLTTLPRR